MTITVAGMLRGQRSRVIGVVHGLDGLRFPLKLQYSGQYGITPYAAIPVDNSVSGKVKWRAIAGGFPADRKFKDMLELLRRPEDQDGYGCTIDLNEDAAGDLKL